MQLTTTEETDTRGGHSQPTINQTPVRKFSSSSTLKNPDPLSKSQISIGKRTRKSAVKETKAAAAEVLSQIPCKD